MTRKSKGSVYIIAEAGVNHNGSVDIAKQLVDIAAEAGANAVKFQSFRAEALVTGTSPKASYQKTATRSGESQLDMLRRLELSETEQLMLMQHCRARKIEFLSTPFDDASIDFLARRADVRAIKLPSGEITNGPLLLRAARTKKPVILSTGMSTLAEIRTALGVLAFGYTGRGEGASLEAFRKAYRSKTGQRTLKSNVTLLHCTTEYPAPFLEVNLRAMDAMRTAFGLPVGLSDHTQGISVSIAAAALGAAVIEKHFTLDRTLPGPDHKASLGPDELRRLVQSIREVESALGSSRKAPTGSELKNLRVARRSLVALKDINSGESFVEENVGCKRPGTGVSPLRYWQILGKKAAQNYRKDEMIKA